MKLYLYYGMDGNGKATYTRIEISEEDVVSLVQRDYEKRKETDVEAIPRSAQEIMDEMNAEQYNSDRRYWYLQDKKQDIRTDDKCEGSATISRIDLFGDDTYGPEDRLLNAERQSEVETILEEFLSSLTEVQKRRVIAHFVECKTLREIAEEEGVSNVAINKSIQSARKILKRNGIDL